MKSRLLILPTILFFAVTAVSATFVFADTASTSQLTAAELLLQSLQSLQSPAPPAQSATVTATSTTNSPQAPTVPIGVSLPSLVQLNANLVPDNAIIPQPPPQEASWNVQSATVPPTTASSTAGLISSLYAEVQTLEAQIALLQTPSATTTPSAAPASPSPTCATLVFTRNLALGSKGRDVSALQQFLGTEGYYTYPSITGYFGPVTEQAVEAFQSASGIEAVGEVGPITGAKIAALSTACAHAATSATTTTSPTSTTAVTPIFPSLTFGGGGEGGGGGGGGSTPDTTPPTVSLTAPANGATISGSSITLTATALDNVAVANVQFKVNGANIGSAITSSPYTTTWDSTGVTDGTYTLYAVAEDTSGNYATSSISVTVDNLVPISGGSADLYWVGGSGNWSDPHHWAITSGGTGQYDPPTAANVVHFDASSSASSYTVTIDAAASSATTTVANPASGSSTFAGSASWTNAGGLTLVSGMGWTYTGAMTFNATTLDKTITTAGVVLNNSITFNGTGGGWTDQDNLSDGSNDTITLTAGTWNTNGETITTGAVSLTGSTARTATFTNSTFNLIEPSATAWNATTITNLTRTLTGSTINMSGAAASFQSGNILTYNAVNFTGGGGMNLSGGGTHVSLSVIGTSAMTDRLSVHTTATITGTLTLSGSAQNKRLFISSNVQGTNRTFTAAAVSLANVDFSNITGAGAASPFTGTSLGDAQGNSGITFTAATTAYWVGNGGNYSDATDHWSTSDGGSPGAPMPLPQDTADFTANSFISTGQSVTFDEPRYGAVNFTGSLNSPNAAFVNNNVAPVYGSWTLASGMTTTGGGLASFTWSNLSGTDTLTTNGVVLAATVQINGLGGTLSLGSDLTTTSPTDTGSLNILAGTFNANNHNVTTNGQFQMAGTSVRSLIMGSGVWTIQTFFMTPWQVSGSGFTLNAGASTIKFDSGSPTVARTFIGGGQIYNNFEWPDEGAPSTLIMTGANTFNDFTVDPSASARTLTMPASATNTAMAFSLAGSATGQLSIVSSSPGTQATLSQSSGTVSGNYLTIQDSAATGGATFNTTNSVNVSNNSGWNFQ